MTSPAPAPSDAAAPAQRADRSRERILVRAPNWLGDAVMTTPALRALRRQRPEAWIVVQLPSHLAPLLEGSGLCDEVWSLASRSGGLRGWRADVARIAADRFDLGIAMPESISSALLMRLGRVGRVVGFARDPLRRALLHRAVPAPADWGRRRMVSRERFGLVLVAAALGDETDGGRTSAAEGGVRALASPSRPEPDLRLALSVTAAETARLARALAEAGLASEAFAADPPVVLAPGASFGAAKCWPAESFAALAERLRARGLPVLLLGAPGESARLRAVCAAMERPEAVGVLDGSLDLGALKALMRGARALVANDAGARHVAAAFGLPSVIFFGPTSVAKTPDNRDAIEVLERDHACRPCYLRRCPIDHRCLRSIGVDEAEAATLRLIDQRSDVAGAADA